MRVLALLFCATALAACTPPARETASSACARSAAHEVTWSNANAPDTITASSEGPSCAQAVVTLSIRNASGDALWAHAETYYALTAGDGLPAGEQPAVSPEQMDSFLTGLARVSETRSSTLPEWREGVATLSQSAQTFSYDTPFDRETYEMLRGRDLPMLCYAAAAEASDCLIIDPFSSAPARLVSFGP
jgi:hypothetical protein